VVQAHARHGNFSSAEVWLTRMVAAGFQVTESTVAALVRSFEASASSRHEPCSWRLAAYGGTGPGGDDVPPAAVHAPHGMAEVPMDNDRSAARDESISQDPGIRPTSIPLPMRWQMCARSNSSEAPGNAGHA